ncbi:iron-containing alcohol dehydrogenase [Youngiibacter multivorans]|uniref:Alcohol dehydrogenase class IV n=1 Tax=Youngiibacter multivorans TaxID=937251 RepID=A0ABS4G358_9CLOT|nr:iron-containing alcohol dehydrogenase [Youngiibacter multivorans]MBP1918982.1 alcohol dehydrogenase class IV [Youngiibacter multivorans]
MLDKYNLKMPKEVYSGVNALDKLKDILKGKKKVVIFTDKGIANSGLLEIPLQYVKEAGVSYDLLDDLKVEPSCDEVQEVVDRFKATNAELIIAVGGGSVMDTAKLASVLFTNEYTVRDLLADPSKAVKNIKTLMIPTTAGTGSEATPNSIVLVPEKQMKVGIVNDEMISDYVILDAVMIKKLPRKIAAATEIDALSHAIECYTSNKANPFSNMFALESLDLIMNNIEEACNNPEAMEAKNSMMIASFYAGVAIATSGTTAVHALSYPLGGKYHVPHGVSNAIMLMPVMRFNEPMCRELFAKAYDRVSRSNPALTVEEKSKWMLNRLQEILVNLDIPTNLKDYNVPESDLDILVESGMEVQRLLVNNMRHVTHEDARALYLEVL